MNISVPISSSIAAYSRIDMSHYLNKYSDNILYIDTDGIKTDCKLDDNEVDNKKLGYMKFEYKLAEFVGLGPKAYGGVIAENKKDTNDICFTEIVKF